MNVYQMPTCDLFVVLAGASVSIAVIVLAHLMMSSAQALPKNCLNFEETATDIGCNQIDIITNQVQATVLS